MIKFTFELQRFASENPYANLDDDAKKNLFNTSIPHIRMFSMVVNSPLIKPLLEQDEGKLAFFQKWVSPVLKYIAAAAKLRFDASELQSELTIVTSVAKISDSLLGIIKEVADLNGTKTYADFGEEITKIVSEITTITRSVATINGKSTLFRGLAAAALGYCANIIATFDSITPEENAALGKAAVRLIGAEITTIVKEVAKGSSLVNPFGPIDIAVSVGLAIVEGISQSEQREIYYRDDGLPEDIALKEAKIDAILFGLHEGFSNYVKGMDDWIFNVGQALGECFNFLGAAFTGNLDSFEFTISEMNYVEWIREIAKRGEYNSSSDADTISVSTSGVSIYAQDGDDYIENTFPNVTILAGHGNDTVSSYGGAKYNSILGGNGNDYLYITNSNSTIEGGKDDDHLLIYKDKNKIYGDDGNDILYIQGEANTVSCGAGTDLIELSGATKTVIEYTQGDGVDAIYGYDASTLLKIKGEYSTQVSGYDVIIAVGNGGLIVKGAKDLQLNINTIEPEEDETLPSDTEGGFTPLSSGLVFTPSFWDSGDAIRGTNTKDRIENTLDNVMLYSFDGDDTIVNYGNNVTINAGSGNDHVENYGSNVKINGGSGDDYIYSEGYKATISGGDGKDTVNSTGNDSRIDGGDDMDSIKNSGENTDINSGAGNDRIINLASNAEISGYLDENYIYNTEDNVTIDGSEDNDIIYNSGASVSINAGAGNNSISIDGSAGGYNTIEAGDGQNTIEVGERDETESKRYYNQIYVGNGGNYINNNVEESTIIAGSGSDTIITGGDGNGIYWSDDPRTSIIAGAGNNKISVNTVMNYGEIYAGGGNDFVSVVSGDNNKRK